MIAEGIDISSESVRIIDEGCNLDKEMYHDSEFLDLAEDLYEEFNSYESSFPLDHFLNIILSFFIYN